MTVMDSSWRICRAPGEVRNRWSVWRTRQPVDSIAFHVFGHVRWVDGPLTQTCRQLTKQPLTGRCLSVEVDRVALDEGIVDDRLALLTSRAATVVEPRTRSEAVLRSEHHRQVKDVGPTAVREAVPIEVCRCQTGIEDRTQRRQARIVR